MGECVESGRAVCSRGVESGRPTLDRLMVAESGIKIQ